MEALAERLNSTVESKTSTRYCPECGASRDRYLSVKSAARIFDHTEEAVRDMIKRREIPFYKRNSRVFVTYREFENLLVRYPSINEINADGD